MNFCVLSARNAISFPERSSSINVTPPDVPTPGIAGGGNRKALAPGSSASRLFTFLKIGRSCSSGFLRSAQGSSVTKKNAL